MAQLQIGNKAPDFHAMTDEGSEISLSDLRGSKIILYFYPKDDTSGCTTQACGFRDKHENVKANNAVVIGVSPDDIESHRKFKAKFNLPFTLVVDADHKIADQYGVWGEKSLYGNKYMGVIRSHFIIAEDGILEDVQYKVSPKNSIMLGLAAVM